MCRGTEHSHTDTDTQTPPCLILGNRGNLISMTFTNTLCMRVDNPCIRRDGRRSGSKKQKTEMWGKKEECTILYPQCSLKTEKKGTDAGSWMEMLSFHKSHCALKTATCLALSDCKYNKTASLPAWPASCQCVHFQNNICGKNAQHSIRRITYLSFVGDESFTGI